MLRRMAVRLEPLVAGHAALLGPILADADALRSTRIPEPPGPGHVHAGTLRSSHLEHGIRIEAELWSRLPGDPPTPAPRSPCAGLHQP